MQSSNQNSTIVRHYAKIPLSVRMKLVELVFLEQRSINKASKILAIRPSTAKLIIKMYRNEGRFFQSKSNRLERVASANEENSHLNNSNLERAYLVDKPNQPEEEKIALLPLQMPCCLYGSISFPLMGNTPHIQVVPWRYWDVSDIRYLSSVNQFSYF